MIQMSPIQIKFETTCHVACSDLLSLENVEILTWNIGANIYNLFKCLFSHKVTVKLTTMTI